VDPRLSLEAVEAMVAERRRKADVRRRAAAARLRTAAIPRSPDVTMRLASSGDAGALERLAQLDSARSPSGPTLVAEVGGELVAALPLDGGRPLADPFTHTTDIVRMLELRAAQLTADGRLRRQARRLTPRTAER
jgi:hypothetical protein